ncbi:LysR substrate-binding domain-containing protein [Azospirillum sp.]|uniref:LysR substrate-binding domain-containing protein n=1 Tax=Azospirillum sp. TaxID=34012 RepID=UPI002D51E9F0|nr:LysR substrate-binding domain-containing protein [Azospirillum sp.]HYD70781.1 LysR substrate-binding domain-containing protein [Azospirillum sp.]
MAAMPANLDTDLLRAFVAVADARSFTRAAEALLRTQAAVSQQVKRLEDAVGKRVFERDTRGVRLTRDGEQLLPYARRMLSLNDEIMAAMRPAAAARPIRIGSPDDYATMLLPRVLARFAQAHPDVPVEVTCDNSVDLVPALEAGRYDLALVTQHPSAERGTLVRREPLVWVAPPDDGVERQEPLPLALFPQGCLCRGYAVRALEGIGRSWRVAITSDSVVAIHGAVLGGLGVTAMEACTVPPGLRVLGAEDGFPDLPPVDIALHHAPGTPSAAVRALAGAVLEVLGRP